ncbi:MAG: sulfite exporter TauE/SafE family protein [bacterium]|nr:sulfite exporter TauE/SafE family protein [bacterium]
MPTAWFGLLIVGVIAGILSGMFGIGGGVVIVPALIIFLQFTITEATSTSLAALLMPVAIFAVLQYYRQNLIDVRGAALIAFGLLITSWFGADIALNLNKDVLQQIYGVFLLYMSWRFIEPRQLYFAWDAKRKGIELEKPKVSATTAPPNVSPLVPLGIGLVAGIASGMFGIGGGAVIVPALVGFFNYDQKLAVGTSLGALLLPVGLPGVLRYAAAGTLNIPVAILVAVGLVIGAFFGARIALGLPSKTVKQLYGVFLVFVALRFIFG